MLWFAIALTGYFLLALVFILDKFILTKSVSKPSVYAFYSTIFLFGAFLAYPLGVQLLSGTSWLWALASGLAFGFGLWTMYEAMALGETSHIAPFIGAIVTIATFIFSYLFLAETLNAQQVIGMIVLVGASLLLSIEKSEKYTGIHIGFLWGVVSGLLFGLSHVAAKYVYVEYDFLTGFVWSRGFVGIVGLIALFAPAVRRTLFAHKTRNQKIKKAKGSWSVLSLVSADKLLGVLGVIFIQYASAIGPTTPVFAMTGIQFALMFILILMLTKFIPRIFRESFTRRELVTQSIAMIFVVVGSALFVL